MYNIVFFDKTIKKITEELYEKIIQATMTDAVGIEIDGGFYKFTSIQKILSDQDFYEQYPALRPDTHQPYKDQKALGYDGVIKSAKKGSHLEALARGIKKAIEKRAKQDLKSPNAEKLLVMARQRYSLLMGKAPKKEMAVAKLGVSEAEDVKWVNQNL